MKKEILFKTLVDIIYILHFMGLVGIALNIPYGVININQVNMNVMDWNIFHWLIFIISLIAYIIFLRGLYFLRKMSRFLLSNRYFSKKIIHNLKKSGKYFLQTGIILFVLYFVPYVYRFCGGEIELMYEINLLIPLFLTMIGLFFTIQSDSLILAKNMKEENELTV